MNNGTKVVLCLCIFSTIYTVLFNFMLPEDILKKDISMKIYHLYFVYRMIIVPTLFFSVPFLFLKFLGKNAKLISIEYTLQKACFILSVLMLALYFMLLGVCCLNQENCIIVSMIMGNTWVFILPGVLLAIGM